MRKKGESRSKVALFLPNMYGGGAQRIMVTLANEFVTLGVEVDLIVANYSGPYCQDVSSEVRVINLEASRALTSLPGLINYLRSEKPAGLLSTLMYANVIAVCAHWLSRSGARLVVREAVSLSRFDGQPNSIKRTVLIKMAKYAYRYANSVISISEDSAKDIVKVLKINRDKIECIYNPAYNKCNGSGGRFIRSKNSDRCIILSAGRLSPVKDFLTLVESFSILVKEKKAYLVILGQGVEKEEIKRTAKELGVWRNMAMPGFVENPFSYMRLADVFVLSSRSEAFGNVLVESMACGTPVVSTDCPGGPAEILENGKWGHLVPVGDPEALADAIIDTLEEPPARPEKLIERAKNFSPRKIAEQYLSIIMGDEK